MLLINRSGIVVHLERVELELPIGLPDTSIAYRSTTNTQSARRQTIAYVHARRGNNVSARSESLTVSQDSFSRARIRQRDVLERLDSPLASLPCQHREDQRVDSVRPRRMGRANREPAPEVHDRRIVTDRDHVDQFVLQRGIAVDGCVDGCMQLDNRLDAAYVVPEPVYECRIFVEQCSEGLHVVTVPGGLKRVGRVFRLSHLNHLNSRKCLHWAARHPHRVLAVGRPKRILPHTACRFMAGRYLSVISSTRVAAPRDIQPGR